MRLASPSRALIALVAACAVALPVLAQNTGFSGSLIARKLRNYDPPTQISIEPMDDNAETVAAAEAVRKAFERQGLKIVDRGGFVLEIEVDPAATTGIGSRGERMGRNSSRGVTANDGSDSLRQLAPTEELSPQPHARDRQLPVRVPHLAVTLNLYDADAVPVWTALAMARRSGGLEQQSAELALAAIDWFGRSNDRGAKSAAPAEGQTADGR
mgnify:CR=1 FL=1